MVKKNMLDAIAGNGPLTQVFRLDPIEQVNFSHDVIYDLTEEKKVLHVFSIDNPDKLDELIENGQYFHKQLSHVTSKCLGLHPDPSVVLYLLQKHAIFNITVANVVTPGNAEILADQWDYIVLSDILELVESPVKFLQDIAENYKDKINKVIIRVSNALSMASAQTANNLGAETVNIEQKYLFTPYTLCKAAHEGGLQPENIYMALEPDANIKAVRKNHDRLQKTPILCDSIILEASWRTT